MASSAREPKQIHQDYLARIRYSNTLPPPPNPPRLLDIPNTGLAGGQYTAPGFASRLAREQPLNIEPDAELGMPLDLVGMPGIFDGDESSIQAPLHTPAVHPHDRALLTPLRDLGKPKLSDTNVSFLRRSEYITGVASKGPRFDTTSSATVGNIGRAKRPRINIDRESPEYIKSQIAKSFDMAASNLRDTSRIVHPSKRGLKLVGAYPVIPDLEAYNDVGGFIEVKFGKHPSVKDTYDTRLETGILRPLVQTEAEKEERVRLQEAYNLDPAHNPKPPGEDDYDYEFHLLPNAAQSEDFKRKFDPADLRHNDDTLYPVTRDNSEGEPEGVFKFEHVRTYETVSQTGDAALRYDEELIISIDDGERSGRQRAAYYYPVVSKIQIDPRRKKNMAKKYQSQVEEEDPQKADFLEVRITDADEETTAGRKEWFNFEKEDVNEAPQQATPDGDEDGLGEPDDEVPAQAVVQTWLNGAEANSQG